MPAFPCFPRLSPRFPLLPLILCLLLSACAQPRLTLEPEVEGGDPNAEIVDLRRLPQNLTVFAKRLPARPLLDAAVQNSQFERYKTLFFAPWDQTRSRIKAKDAFSVLGTRKKSTARGYRANRQPWSQAQWDALVHNANSPAYPSMSHRAITVRPTSLREVPTALPRYLHPSHPTFGPPFDMFQYAWLPLGMPLFIAHATRDRAWYFVENALVGGWVSAADVAFVDDAVAETCRSTGKGRLAALLFDRTSLPDSAGKAYLPETRAGLGTVLPVTASGEGTLDVLVPVRNPQGQAVLRTARLTTASAALMPMPLTPEAVARVGNPLLGNPYGWGGVSGDRDCSSTLRDLYTPFGIWLPRNSRGQARAWDFVSLDGLSSAEKLARIKAEGRPFATLLWLPGHITLYIGQYHNEAAMFHNMWGIRTVVPGSDDGRFVIGRAVITSTRPGAELPNLKTADPILSSMKGMAVLR